MEECAKIKCSDGEGCNIVEGIRCRDRAVVGVNELEGFIVIKFLEHLCRDLIYCISYASFGWNAEAEFLYVFNRVNRCFGTFGGLSAVVAVVVVVGRVASWGVIVVVSCILVHGRVRLGRGV